MTTSLQSRFYQSRGGSLHSFSFQIGQPAYKCFHGRQPILHVALVFLEICKLSFRLGKLFFKCRIFLFQPLDLRVLLCFEFLYGHNQQWSQLAVVHAEFNSRMRDELLNGELFLHIDEMKYVVQR